MSVVGVRAESDGRHEAAITFTQDGTEIYWIPLCRCRTSAEVLDWILQLAGKTWMDDAAVGRLVRVFDEVLDPQATLCSHGAERGPILDMAATLRRIAQRNRDDERGALFGSADPGRDDG